MATNNFFKVKKGINLPVYTDVSDLTTNGFSDSTGTNGDLAFAGDVAYYKENQFGKVTPVGGVIEYTNIAGPSIPLDSTYYAIRVTSNANTTVVLPNPTSVPTGKMYIIRNSNPYPTYSTTINASTNSATIDGASSYVCDDGESVTVVSDGSAWHIL